MLKVIIVLNVIDEIVSIPLGIAMFIVIISTVMWLMQDDKEMPKTVNTKELVKGSMFILIMMLIFSAISTIGELPEIEIKSRFQEMRITALSEQRDIKEKAIILESIKKAK